MPILTHPPKRPYWYLWFKIENVWIQILVYKNDFFTQCGGYEKFGQYFFTYSKYFYSQTTRIWSITAPNHCSFLDLIKSPYLPKKSTTANIFPIHAYRHVAKCVCCLHPSLPSLMSFNHQKCFIYLLDPEVMQKFNFVPFRRTVKVEACAPGCVKIIFFWFFQKSIQD